MKRISTVGQKSCDGGGWLSQTRPIPRSHNGDNKRNKVLLFLLFPFLAVEDYVWFTGQHSPTTDSNCMFLLAVYEYAGRDHDCASSEYPICQLK